MNQNLVHEINHDYKKEQRISTHALADRDSPTRPGRSIKMGLYLYINLKFNRSNTLLLSWGDRAAARYGPQDGPPVHPWGKTRP
jgi:hypothetical protein